MAFDELYQEIIRDHYKHPRNKKPLSHVKAFENPSCGDTVKVELDTAGERIQSVYFDGSGCSISMCSASMMSDLLSGRTVDEARRLVEEFLAVIRGEISPEKLDELGDLAALKGVVELPVRVKCATLAWHAVEQALNQQPK
ncbi:MAG: SUF system NifU family Fe-S cluster assembly protein [Spirochaetales bacterium]|nr:SUF system NifU family Fe-S cluster assembly protein [Spirochaetales bacterium]